MDYWIYSLVIFIYPAYDNIACITECTHWLFIYPAYDNIAWITECTPCLFIYPAYDNIACITECTHWLFIYPAYDNIAWITECTPCLFIYPAYDNSKKSLIRKMECGDIEYFSEKFERKLKSIKNSLIERIKFFLVVFCHWRGSSIWTKLRR